MFGKENVFVIKSEAYYSNKSHVLNAVVKFLGLPPYSTKAINYLDKKKISNRTRNKDISLTNYQIRYIMNVTEPWKEELKALFKETHLTTTYGF